MFRGREPTHSCWKCIKGQNPAPYIIWLTNTTCCFQVFCQNRRWAVLFVGTAMKSVWQEKIISFWLPLSILWSLIQSPLQTWAELPEGLECFWIMFSIFTHKKKKKNVTSLIEIATMPSGNTERECLFSEYKWRGFVCLFVLGYYEIHRCGKSQFSLCSDIWKHSLSLVLSFYLLIFIFPPIFLKYIVLPV